MKKQPFVITTTIERELSEFFSSRDDAVQISVWSAVDSPNFHWLELKMADRSTRIEALRAHAGPDRQHQWEWPEGFLILTDGPGGQTRETIQRGYRGAGLAQIEIRGRTLMQFDPIETTRQKGFLSLSFKVGRLTKMISRKTERKDDHE